jgi:hypothetical protein
LGISSTEKIYNIGQSIDEGNRTFNLFIKPTKYLDRIKPNMLAIITAAEFKESNVITVPTRLIRNQGDKRYVFVANKQSDGTYVAEKRDIEIERSFIDRSIIFSGLKQGELLIKDGFQSVTHGDILNLR